MKAKRLLKEARGISPLIATLILVAATIAGGAIVFGVMRSQMNALSPGASIQIQEAKIVVTSEGSGLALVTVQNTGSTVLTNVTVTVENATPVSIAIPAAGLVSGHTASVNIPGASGAWVLSTSYTITVQGTAPSGENVQDVTAVFASAS